jgi:hypothetical protein
VDFINDIVVIVATEGFTNQLPPLPEDAQRASQLPPGAAEMDEVDEETQSRFQPTEEGEGEEATQIAT